MNEKVQYIHCPECNGVLENKIENEVIHSSTGLKIHRPGFRCIECGSKYIIQLDTKNIVKFKVIPAEFN